MSFTSSICAGNFLRNGSRGGVVHRHPAAVRSKLSPTPALRSRRPAIAAPLRRRIPQGEKVEADEADKGIACTVYSRCCWKRHLLRRARKSSAHPERSCPAVPQERAAATLVSSSWRE